MSKDSFDRDCALDVLREMTKLAIAPGQTANRTGEQMPTHQLGVPRQWVHFHAGANHEQAQQRTAQDPFMAGGMRSAVRGMGPRGMSARPPLNRNVATAPQGARAIHQPGMMRHASANKEALKRLLSERLLEKRAGVEQIPIQGARAAMKPGFWNTFREAMGLAERGAKYVPKATPKAAPQAGIPAGSGGPIVNHPNLTRVTPNQPVTFGNPPPSSGGAAKAVTVPMRTGHPAMKRYISHNAAGQARSFSQRQAAKWGGRWGGLTTSNLPANRLLSTSRLPTYQGLRDAAGKLTPELEPLHQLGGSVPKSGIGSIMHGIGRFSEQGMGHLGGRRAGFGPRLLGQIGRGATKGGLVGAGTLAFQPGIDALQRPEWAGGNPKGRGHALWSPEARDWVLGGATSGALLGTGALGMIPYTGDWKDTAPVAAMNVWGGPMPVTGGKGLLERAQQKPKWVKVEGMKNGGFWAKPGLAHGALDKPTVQAYDSVALVRKENARARKEGMDRSLWHDLQRNQTAKDSWLNIPTKSGEKSKQEQYDELRTQFGTPPVTTR